MCFFATFSSMSDLLIASPCASISRRYSKFRSLFSSMIRSSIRVILSQVHMELMRLKNGWA